MAKTALFMERLSKTELNLNAFVPLGVAMPIHNVPTGLSSVPPLGPAMPLVESP